MSQAGLRNTGGGGGGVDSLIVHTDSGNASPIADTINFFGAGGITVTADGVQTVTITGSGSGFTWQVVTSANNPVTLTASNGYITKGVSPVDFIFPASAAIGDTFKIIGYANLWTIAQNANQLIKIGIVTSTTGVTGSVTATTVSDCLEIVCVTANLEFFCNVIQGNPQLA